MRGATECAKRLKQFVSGLRSRLGKISLPAVTDPITQLILGILSRDTPEARASEGLERLRAMVVDYNELRVIPPLELSHVLHDFPDARLKCEDISRALNAVFALEHAISLNRLAGLSRRESQAVLDKLDGLEPYTRARVQLLGLRNHAVPLDEAMWASARQEGIVDARCPLAEAQQFLERQIPEGEALEFYAMLKKHAWVELGGAVRRREVARIQSVPPDRTSRNMLQMVSASLELADENVAAVPEPAAPAAPRKPPERGKPTATAGKKVSPAKRDKPAARSAADDRAARSARTGATDKSRPSKSAARKPERLSSRSAASRKTGG